MRRAPSLARTLIRDPRQARHLPRVVRTNWQEPLEARLPWLAFDVIDWLGATLTPSSRVFEYGGGGSTAFFVDRAAEVVTVEHDSQWTAALQDRFASEPKATVIAESSADQYRSYISRISNYPDAHFDFVIVDGRERVRCVEASVAHVAPGGYLMLDDTDRARYEPAHHLLPGWPFRVFHGVSPFKSQMGHTTVWRKPGGPFA